MSRDRRRNSDDHEDDDVPSSTVIRYRKWAAGDDDMSRTSEWRKMKKRSRRNEPATHPGPSSSGPNVPEDFHRAADDHFIDELQRSHVINNNQEFCSEDSSSNESSTNDDDPDPSDDFTGEVVGVSLSDHNDSSADGEDDAGVSQLEPPEEVNVLDLVDIVRRDLYDGSPHSLNKAVLMVMEIFTQNKGVTKKCLGHIASVVSALLSQPNSFPSSEYKLLNFVEKLAPTFKAVKHYFCQSCEYYWGPILPVDPVCLACQGKEVAYMFEFPLEDAIRQLFEKRKLAQVLKKRQSRCDQDICDITDGNIYKSFRDEMGQFDVTLIFNTDGVKIRKSSSGSQLWPIQCTICEVPPRLRRYFLIVCGVTLSSKPTMNTFLRPFVMSLRKIRSDGGVKWVHPITNQGCVSMVRAPFASMDAPARSQSLNMIMYMGRFSCGMCYIVGKSVPTAKGHKMVFPPEEEISLRTAEEMFRDGANATRANAVRGLFGPTILSYIPDFDCARGIRNEYMHGSVLGVGRQFLVTWLTDKRGGWYIPPRKVCEIDDYLMGIRRPDTIKRAVRPLKDWKMWKAAEWLWWILFYSVPALQGILENRYLQQWMLFVKALYLFLQDRISPTDLKLGESLLKIFVSDIKNLYFYEEDESLSNDESSQDEEAVRKVRRDEWMYSYNVHQLLHLADGVADSGPLWAPSAFPFEDSNGALKNLIHGTNSLDKELVSNLQILESVRVLKSKVEAEETIILNSNQVGDVSPKVHGDPIHVELSPEERDLIQEFCDDHNCDFDFSADDSVYSRAVKLSEIFFSVSWDRQKTRNSYTVRCVILGNVIYGEILYFLKIREKVFCMLRKLEVDHRNVLLHEETNVILKHIVPIRDIASCKKIIVDFNDVKVKVIRVHQYVCIRPNSVEVNL